MASQMFYRQARKQNPAWKMIGCPDPANPPPLPASPARPTAFLDIGHSNKNLRSIGRF